jgi:hypothetical protein
MSTWGQHSYLVTIGGDQATGATEIEHGLPTPLQASHLITHPMQIHCPRAAVDITVYTRSPFCPDPQPPLPPAVTRMAVQGQKTLQPIKGLLKEIAGLTPIPFSKPVIDIFK